MRIATEAIVGALMAENFKSLCDRELTLYPRTRIESEYVRLGDVLMTRESARYVSHDFACGVADGEPA